MHPPAPFLVWQLVDSAFPTGGFAHSGGIEVATHLGLIHDQDSLRLLLEDLLMQWATQSAPLTAAAWDGDVALADLDHFCQALLVGNGPGCRASRAQGRALLMAAENLHPACAELRRAMVASQAPLHLAVMLGAVAAVLGLDRLTTVHIAGFLTLRGAVSAAIRLNIVGPLAAQGLQHALGPAVHAAVERGRDIAWQDAATSRPLLDIWHAHHDRLYSRLFQS